MVLNNVSYALNRVFDGISWTHFEDELEMTITGGKTTAGIDVIAVYERSDDDVLLKRNIRI